MSVVVQNTQQQQQQPTPPPPSISVKAPAPAPLIPLPTPDPLYAGPPPPPLPAPVPTTPSESMLQLLFEENMFDQFESRPPVTLQVTILKTVLVHRFSWFSILWITVKQNELHLANSQCLLPLSLYIDVALCAIVLYCSSLFFNSERRGTELKEVFCRGDWYIIITFVIRFLARATTKIFMNKRLHGTWYSFQ